ncbi:MAG: hypothetical protein ABFC77_08420 [Thermoguttaceae bacterium]
MFFRRVLLAASFLLLGVVSLFADEGVLGQKYGGGVHAFFAGDYSGACEQLTAAVEGGSQDPRTFYFRGLAMLKLGRESEAKQDFQAGASLESRDANKFYNVSKSLERVQGSARVELERYRLNARLAVLEEIDQYRKARYEAIQREESRVLRQQDIAPPEASAAEPSVAEPSAAEPSIAEPAATEPVVEKPVVESVRPKAEAKKPAASVKRAAPVKKAKPAAGKKATTAEAAP